VRRIPLRASRLRRLASAIHAADPGALVACGFTDWSVDKPGLTTGFTPAQAAPEPTMGK